MVLGDERGLLPWYLVMGGDCYHGTWDGRGLLPWYLVMGGDCYHGTW